MLRCLVFAASITTTITLSTTAGAGLFSSHGGRASNECCPTCATPQDCYVLRPDCASPTACVPNCCTPNVAMHGCADDCCGEIDCNGSYCGSNDGCVKSGLKKLWELEKRKNRCLIDTFFGRRTKSHSHCDGLDCVPNYYYQSQRVAPHACH